MALLPASIRGHLADAAAKLERARLNAGRRRAEAAVRTMEKGGWRAQPSVRTGVPLAELLEGLKEARADLLVLGARGTGGLARLLLGSVTEGRSGSPPCPSTSGSSRPPDRAISSVGGTTKLPGPSDWNRSR